MLASTALQPKSFSHNSHRLEKQNLRKHLKRKTFLRIARQCNPLTRRRRTPKWNTYLQGLSRLFRASFRVPLISREKSIPLVTLICWTVNLTSRTRKLLLALALWVRGRLRLATTPEPTALKDNGKCETITWHGVAATSLQKMTFLCKRTKMPNGYSARRGMNWTLSWWRFLKMRQTQNLNEKTNLEAQPTRLKGVGWRKFLESRGRRRANALFRQATAMMTFYAGRWKPLG